MLRINDLHVYYDLAQVVHSLDVELETGRVLGLIGRNGAGKSSTIKSIVGFHQATGGHIRGEIFWQDQALHTQVMEKRVALGLGYVPEERRIFAKLSIEDNLCVAVRSPARLKQQLKRVYALFPELYDLRSRMAGLLSGGQQQMLCIGRTLMGESCLLLLDEPSEGLAPLLVQRIGEALGQLNQEGMTMIIAEQNLRFCQQLCHDFLVLHQGRAVEKLNANTVKQEPQRLLNLLRL